MSLNGTSPFVPSTGGYGSLNPQCRSDIFLKLYLHSISRHFGTNPNFYAKNDVHSFHSMNFGGAVD